MKKTLCAVLALLLCIGLSATLASCTKNEKNDNNNDETLIEIPNVEHMSADQATQELEKLGFKVSITRKSSKSHRVDTAIKTEPKNAEKAAKNSDIVLYICERPYNYDLTEYITLGSYPNVEYEKTELDEALQQEIRSITSKYAEKSDVNNRAVQNGDIANIDFVGKIDGVEFEGGSASGYDLEIGSGSFIDGFESGLIGKNIGETTDLNLRFPDDYHSLDFAGKNVVFTVKINSIKSVTYPELTDDMVKSNTPYQSVSEFTTAITKETLEYIVWENFVESCTVIKYPEKEVNEYYEEMLAKYQEVANTNGLTFEYYATLVGYANVDEFTKAIKESANNTVKNEMALYLAARNDGLSLNAGQYEAKGTELALSQGFTSLSEIEEYAGKGEIETLIYLYAVLDNVVTNAVAK